MNELKKRKAKMELIESNRSYASKLAVQFYNNRRYLGIEFEDIEAAAMLGLCDAARLYDLSPSRDFKWYSYYRIRGSMYDFVRQSGGMSRFYFKKLTAPMFNKKGARINRDNGMPFRIANDLTSLKRLQEVVAESGIRLHVNMDKESAELSYENSIDPERKIIEKSRKFYVEKAIKNLSPTYQRIIKDHYYDGRSMEEIRIEMGKACKSSVSRMHIRALRQLRTIINENCKAVDTKVNYQTV